MARRKKKREVEETLVDIVEVKERTEDFFEKNKTLIISAVIGIAVLAAGYFAYKYLYQIPRETKASEELYKAQYQFERDSFALALQNPGEGYIGFLDIAKKYKGTSAGNISKYYAGVSYMNMGNFDEAISFLTKFKPKGLVTPIMKHGALGDCYSEKEELDKAINSYKKAINAGENEMLNAYYMNKLALLHGYMGNTDQAVKAFKELKQKFPASREGLAADKYIANYGG